MPLLLEPQQSSPALQGHLRATDTARAACWQHHDRIPTPSACIDPAHLHFRCRHMSGGGQLEGAQGLNYHELEPAPRIRPRRSHHIWYNGRYRKMILDVLY